MSTTRTLIFVAVASLAALLLGAPLVPAAQPQIQANPNYVAIGTSSSGGASTVWFHEPAARQVLACQTVVSQGGGLSAVQCVGAKLP
jgi:hypothetical protein